MIYKIHCVIPMKDVGNISSIIVLDCESIPHATLKKSVSVLCRDVLLIPEVFIVLVKDGNDEHLFEM